MIRDKGGVWHGRFGKEVYYRKRDGGQGIRRMPKSPYRPNSKRQKLWKVVFGKSSEHGRICYLVTEKLYDKYIDKDRRQPYLPPSFWNDMTLSSAALAISCGWKEPMSLIPNYGDLEPFRREKPEVIWGDIVNGKMRLLIFTPSPRNIWSKIVRISLRICLRLFYLRNILGPTITAMTDWNVDEDEELSMEHLPDFYASKAAEYLKQRWGGWQESYAKKLLRGARFTAFEFGSFPAPRVKFLKEDIKFADLSGGAAHIKADMVGMKEQVYGGAPFYCALKSRFSDDYKIKLPQRKLGKFGKKLTRHLRRIAKGKLEEYLSDPKTAKHFKEYKSAYNKKWKAEHPERMRELNLRYEARKKLRMRDDLEYRKERLAAKAKAEKKWKESYPEKVKEYRRRHSEKGQKPQSRRSR